MLQLSTVTRHQPCTISDGLTSIAFIMVIADVTTAPSIGNSKLSFTVSIQSNLLLDGTYLASSNV